ncbi:MAG: hypothetical protein ACJ756_13570 [Solirubrobacterales bacterium]
MSSILELIAIVAPFIGVAVASQRFGAEQRPGLTERHGDHRGERWAIR